MKKILTGIIVAGALASCNTTQLVSSWTSPQAKTGTTYSKVLVIGMTGSKDGEMRQALEDAVAKKLQDNGIQAQTATAQYGPKSFRTMNEEQAVRTVSDNGFDGVMVVALLDKQQESNYTPGYTTRTPYAVIRNRWYGNYTVLYDRVYNPGYYTTTTDYLLEASFYRTRGDKLIYSAQAKSADPSSASNLADDFSKTVVKDMVDKSVLNMSR